MDRSPPLGELGVLSVRTHFVATFTSPGSKASRRRLTCDLDHPGKVNAMSKPIDYDSPRRPSVETDEDGVEEFRARSTAAQSRELDEAETVEAFELPGADLSGEELTVPVVPMQADEFRCDRCFLVHPHSRLAA